MGFFWFVGGWGVLQLVRVRWSQLIQFRSFSAGLYRVHTWFLHMGAWVVSFCGGEAGLVSSGCFYGLCWGGGEVVGRAVGCGVLRW